MPIRCSRPTYDGIFDGVRAVQCVSMKTAELFRKQSLHDDASNGGILLHARAQQASKQRFAPIQSLSSETSEGRSHLAYRNCQAVSMENRSLNLTADAWKSCRRTLVRLESRVVAWRWRLQRINGSVER